MVVLAGYSTMICFFVAIRWDASPSQDASTGIDPRVKPISSWWSRLRPIERSPSQSTQMFFLADRMHAPAKGTVRAASENRPFHLPKPLTFRGFAGRVGARRTLAPQPKMESLYQSLICLVPKEWYITITKLQESACNQC